MGIEDHYDSRFDDEPSGETPFKAEGEIEMTDPAGNTRQVYYILEGRETWSVNRGSEEEWSINLSDGDAGTLFVATTSKKDAPAIPGWLQPVLDYALAHREDGDFQEWVD